MCSRSGGASCCPIWRSRSQVSRGSSPLERDHASAPGTYATWRTGRRSRASVSNSAGSMNRAWASSEDRSNAGRSVARGHEPDRRRPDRSRTPDAIEWLTIGGTAVTDRRTGGPEGSRSTQDALDRSHRHHRRRLCSSLPICRGSSTFNSRRSRVSKAVRTHSSDRNRRSSRPDTMPREPGLTQPPVADPADLAAARAVFLEFSRAMRCRDGSVGLRGGIRRRSTTTSRWAGTGNVRVADLLARAGTDRSAPLTGRRDCGACPRPSSNYDGIKAGQRRARPLVATDLDRRHRVRPVASLLGR